MEGLLRKLACAILGMSIVGPMPSSVSTSGVLSYYFLLILLVFPCYRFSRSSRGLGREYHRSPMYLVLQVGEGEGRMSGFYSSCGIGPSSSHNQLHSYRIYRSPEPETRLTLANLVPEGGETHTVRTYGMCAISTSSHDGPRFPRDNDRYGRSPLMIISSSSISLLITQ